MWIDRPNVEELMDQGELDPRGIQGYGVEKQKSGGIWRK